MELLPQSPAMGWGAGAGGAAWKQLLHPDGNESHWGNQPLSSSDGIWEPDLTKGSDSTSWKELGAVWGGEGVEDSG